MHLDLKSVNLKFVKLKTDVFQFQSQEWLQKTEDRQTLGNVSQKNEEE